jgi:hypothetical protein
MIVGKFAKNFGEGWGSLRRTWEGGGREELWVWGDNVNDLWDITDNEIPRNTQHNAVEYESQKCPEHKVW